MGRETVTEYEVEQIEKEVEMLFCDHCGDQVGPVGEARLVDIMVNPDIDATTDIPSPASIEQTVLDAMQKTHVQEYDGDVRFSHGMSGLHDRHEPVEVKERRLSQKEYPYLIASKVTQELRQTSGVIVDVTAEYTEEVCPSCARGEFGVDVPEELVNPEQKELLEEKVERLEDGEPNELKIVTELFASMITISFFGRMGYMILSSESYSLIQYVADPLIVSFLTGVFAFLSLAIVAIVRNSRNSDN